MKIIVAVAFYFLYWICCFFATGTDKKNLLWLRSYPDEVQRIVKNDPLLKPYLPKEMSVWSILFGNLLLFTVVFSVLGILLKSVLGLTNYWSAFIYFLLFGEGLGVFDLVVIDILWWRNSASIRFSFIPQKVLYKNNKKHVQSFLRGIPLFAVVAAITAGIVTLITIF